MLFAISVVFILLVAFKIYTVKGVPEWVEQFTSSGKELSDYSQVDSLSSDEVMLVKVYASWCPHCVKMEGEWDKTYDELNGKEINGKKVSVVAVGENNSNQSKLMKQFNISGYPTIVALSRVNDKVVAKPHNGERTKSGFVSFAKSI